MINKIKLEHLVVLMKSNDNTDRLAAEYIRLKQWYESLKLYNTRVEAAMRADKIVVKESESRIPDSVSREMQSALGEVLHLIELFAIYEDINLADCQQYLEDKATFDPCKFGYDPEECERTVKCDPDSDDGKVTDYVQKENLPEEVMSLEDTLRALEYCDMYFDGDDSACAKCPCQSEHNPGFCGGFEKMNKSALYHLQRYAYDR